MRAYESLEAIREADVESLKAVPSMNEKAAVSVYQFFHSEQTENTEDKTPVKS